MAQVYPRYLRLSNSFDFVASTVISYAASTLAIETKSLVADRDATFYQGVAARGVQHAIQSFSQENSEAILSASIALTLRTRNWYDPSHLQLPIPKHADSFGT